MMALKSVNTDLVGASTTPESEWPAKLPVSCAACRQRKVKCDRNQPCSGCRLRNVNCLPAVRTPNTGRNSSVRARRKTELEQRLLSLERNIGGIVDNLGSQLPVEKSGRHAVPLGGAENYYNSRSPEGGSIVSLTSTCNDQSRNNDATLGHAFWSGLVDEFKELRNFLNHDDTHNIAMLPPQPPSVEGQHDTSNKTGPSLKSLYPPRSSSSFLVGVYFSHVEPVLKMLHKKTIRDLMVSIPDAMSSLPCAQECLIFSIYYAATTSLDTDICSKHLGQEKCAALARFQQGVDAALRKADLLNTTDIMVLQALIIYLTTARLSDRGRSVWTLTGLAVRIAVAMNLHREDHGLEYSAAETEVRRRTWWQVYHLELRASEDRGSDSGILEHTFDTALPMNINDADLDNCQHEICARKGFTEMTFSLMVFEVCNVASMLNYVPPKTTIQMKSLTLRQRDSIAREFCDRLQVTYLVHCDPSVPYQRLVILAGQIMMARIRLSVHYPLQRLADPPVQSSETRSFILETALGLIEAANTVESDKELSQFTWLAKTHVPWHALAVVLSELHSRPNLSRAWQVVETSFLRWSERVADTKSGALWQPLQKLYLKVRSMREQQAQRESVLLTDPRDFNAMSIATYTAHSLPHHSSLLSLSNQSSGSEAVSGSVGYTQSNEGFERNSDDSDCHWMIWDSLLQEVQENVVSDQQCTDGYGELI